MPDIFGVSRSFGRGGNRVLQVRTATYVPSRLSNIFTLRRVVYKGFFYYFIYRRMKTDIESFSTAQLKFYTFIKPFFSICPYFIRLFLHRRRLLYFSILFSVRNAYTRTDVRFGHNNIINGELSYTNIHNSIQVADKIVTNTNPNVSFFFARKIDINLLRK